MDPYRELQERLRSVGSNSKMITIWQGIVNSIDGVTCEVQVGGIAIPDVRMKASATDSDNAMMIVPKVGTAVTIGSLSGDLAELVVLKVDEVDHIVINGGKLGGLVNIEALTSKLNEFVQKFNLHTHVVSGTAAAVTENVTSAFKASDYEDKTIKH